MLCYITLYWSSSRCLSSYSKTALDQWLLKCEFCKRSFKIKAVDSESISENEPNEFIKTKRWIIECTHVITYVDAPEEDIHAGSNKDWWGNQRTKKSSGFSNLKRWVKVTAGNEKWAGPNVNFLNFKASDCMKYHRRMLLAGMWLHIKYNIALLRQLKPELSSIKCD